MAPEEDPGTSWSAPKKSMPPTTSRPAPLPPGSAIKTRRKIYYFISVVLIVVGLVIVGFYIMPFVRGFFNMAENFNDEALRMAYLRVTVNYGVATLIGALIMYGGYKLFHATWHPKPDNFPLKPSKPGQVLKPGE